MKDKPKIFLMILFTTIGLAMVVFGLSLGVRAQRSEDTPVPTVFGALSTGETIPLEPESLPEASDKFVNPFEKYLGPEGEQLTANGEPAFSAAVTVMPGDYFLTVPGSNFPPRESAATNAYGGAGCSYRTSQGGFFTYPLILPDGVVIRAIRVIYDDSSTANGTVHLYRFFSSGNSQTYEELSKVNTAGSAGFGIVDSQPFSHTVDAKNESLALILDYATVSGPSLQFCNITVSYSARINLPLVVK